MKHIIKETVDESTESVTDRIMHKIYHMPVLNSTTCLSGEEDLLVHEHADSVDADGTCLECGKTNLI